MSEAHRQGWSVRAIASHFHHSRSTVHRFLQSAFQRRPEQWELVFPANILTPSSEPTFIRDGDPAVCMVSHQTGNENHPSLQKPRPRPKQESKHKFKPKLKNNAK